jgi:hypothetical protein
VKTVKRTLVPSHRTGIIHSRQIQRAEEPRLCASHAEARVKVSAVIETTPCNPSFDRLFLEAVDEVLSSLGHVSKRAIHSHLEKVFNIRKQDIPYQIDKFASAIEIIFGAGAKLLEIRIMKRISEKIGPSFKYYPRQKDLIFTEYVHSAKVEFDEASINAETEVTKLPSHNRTLSWQEQILKLA